MLVSSVECDSRQGLRERLNIIAAAEAHVVWKSRLGSLVRGDSSEPVAAAMLGQDGVCRMECLIGGAPFAAFHGLDAHRQLLLSHEQFHQMASAVIDKMDSGDREGARSLFENEYSRSLHDMIQSLSAINQLLVE